MIKIIQILFFWFLLSLLWNGFCLYVSHIQKGKKSKEFFFFFLEVIFKEAFHLHFSLVIFKVSEEGSEFSKGQAVLLKTWLYMNLISYLRYPVCIQLSAN